MFRTLFILTIIFLSQLANANTLQSFTASYNIYYGDYQLGEGEYQLEKINTERYNFNFSSSMRFLIFSDKREVNVDLSYQDNKVSPYTYTHKREGTGKDYIDLASFNKQENIISAEHKGEAFKVDFDASIYDALSAQLQLMLDLKRGVKKLSYKILDKNRIKERFFEFIKEETIQINEESFHCVLYQIISNKEKVKTQMWFSIEHNFQPVRMTHFENKKKKFNADLNHFSFDLDEAKASNNSEGLKQPVMTVEI